MRKCPHCFGEVQDDATKCKHCKEEISSPSIPTQTKPMPKPKWQWKRWHKIVGLVVFVFYAMFYWRVALIVACFVGLWYVWKKTGWNKKTKIKIGVAVLLFLVIWLSVRMVKESQQEQLAIAQRQAQQSARMEMEIDNGVKVLDIQNAILRLTENYALRNAPFYAIKNVNGSGYVGVVAGLTSPSGSSEGKAVFLVSAKALNQSDVSELGKSIKAVNGLAKGLAPNIGYASGYSYSEVMKWLGE